MENEELKEPKLVTFKCKPTYAFQSIEFEYTCDVNDDNEITNMSQLYVRVLAELMMLAPEQPDAKKPVKKPVKKGPPATARQKAYLKKLGVEKIGPEVTADEASRLITKLEKGEDPFDNGWDDIWDE